MGHAEDHQLRVDEECEQLKKDLTRLAEGATNADGKLVVKFGVLFDDEEGQQYYEALVGTLKAAKKKGFIDFKGQMLLKGMSDNVDISLLVDAE